MLTRREITVIGIAALALLAVVIIQDKLDLSNPLFEYIFLLIFVAPAGYLLATDPERKPK